MSRFRAGAARRSARLCCDEIDGSCVARHRGSTPLPRPPVGPLAGRRASRARRTHLELAASAGLRQRSAAQGVRTGARSGFRRLVRPARSCAAGDRAGSARPLHRPHARGRRRHDARRGWGARAYVAVAHEIFRRAGAGGGAPPGCNSVRSVWPKTSNRTSGGNGGWRRRSPARATGAACSTAARPADRRIGAVQPSVAAALRTVALPAASISPARRRRVSARAPDARPQNWRSAADA